MATIDAAYAQYYSWGSDAPNLKWRDIKSDNFRLVYPDSVDAVARRTLYLLDQTKKDIGIGFNRQEPLDMAIVMHPENFATNGLVMYMPRRVDFLTTPATDTYSMPWVKQLVAHETRHMVQYNNLNQNFLGGLRYALGDQGSALGLLYFPLDVLEGDAVFMETSMSTYGRGLQPSFTMGFRAMGRDVLSRKKTDWLYCGSYKQHIPNHYELGYQIVTYTYDKYKKNIWNDVIEFATRRPYYIMTTKIALKNIYNTGRSEILFDTFKDLLEYWESLPERKNTPQIITPIDSTNYTTYSHPIALSHDKALALKSDYVHPQRFVVVDAESGEEERIAYTGAISTRPTMGENRVWWSEYRRSKLFDQKIFSQLCYLDLNKKSSPKSVKKVDNILYPTAIADSDDHLAYVEYLPNGQYTIIEARIKYTEVKKQLRRAEQLEIISRTEIQYPTEVHGLAWDNKTKELYFIATDDSGMWLGARDAKSDKGFRQLRKGAYITLSDLRAKDGVLYFGSIESGYDEIHCYDIKRGVERRLSQSTYGSFDPATPVKADKEFNFATTYDRYGYHLSRQETKEIYKSVKHTNTPQNIVNPKRTMLDVVNIDEIVFTPTDSVAQTTEVKSRKYNKAAGLINVHSWVPMYVNIFEILDEQVFDINLGLTAVSQNLLSNTEAFAAYGYSFEHGNLLSAGVNYDALGVKLSLATKYGGEQVKYDPFQLYNSDLSKYFSVSGSATLPLFFSGGYHSRQLSLSTGWSYTNGIVSELSKLDSDQIPTFDRGLHKLSFGASFASAARKATRNMATPFGYSLGLSYAFAPTNRDFSSMMRAMASLTTRGFWPNNSFSIAGCYQKTFGGYRYKEVVPLSFSSYSLVPNGYSASDLINNEYKAISLNYKFPIWCPDGGIDSIIFFRRIAFNVGFNAAKFDNPNSSIYRGYDDKIYSYGGDLIIEFVPFSITDGGNTTLNLSLYNRKSGGLTFSMGLSLPI